LLVPLILWWAARGSGLDQGPACLATVLGLLVWWGGPCRQWLETGDLDLLLGSLAALAEVGFLLQFHRAARLVPWLGLLLSGAFCWFTQPPLAMLLSALVLVYYLSVGTKHALAWHLSLFGSLAGGMAVHAFWLLDWFDYWSIRCPLCLEVPLLPHRTLHTIWDAPIWGSGPDRLLAILLIALAIPGVAVWNQTKQRPAARLFGLGMSGFLILAITGIACEPMGILGTPRLLIPAFLFAVVPASHALAQGWQCAVQLTGRPRSVAVVAVGVVIVTVLAGGKVALALGSRFLATAPFLIGLTTAERSIVDMIIAQTDAEARILWEDPPTAEPGSGWTALLPVLTERSFVGGLDTGACIEHGYPSLVSQNLAGRPLDHWSDAELKDFCRHYNIGWVLCRSPGTSARFRGWKEAKPTSSSADAPGVFLFRLPSGSVALRGQARLIAADWRHIILADVVPEDGKVVLSLHYQAGLRVSPSRVQIEKEPDPRDPIPLVRLRVPDPVARLTVTWQPK
jgi:hypothetical protein